MNRCLKQTSLGLKSMTSRSPLMRPSGSRNHRSSQSQRAAPSSQDFQAFNSLPVEPRGGSINPAVEEKEIMLYGEGARLSVRRTGEFLLWRRDLSGTAGTSTDTWALVTAGRVTLPKHASSHWDFSIHRESVNAAEVRWGQGVVLEISPVTRVASRHPWTHGLEKGWVLSLRVQREMATQAEICLDLNRSGYVYGGAHMMRQLWPLNLASLEIGPLTPFDNGPNGINTTVGNAWVTSSGLAVHVDPETPYLHVGVNAPITVEGATAKLKQRTWAVGVQNLFTREYLPRDAPPTDALASWAVDGMLRFQARKTFKDSHMHHPLEEWLPQIAQLRDDLDLQLQGLSDQLDQFVQGTPLSLVDGHFVSPLMTTLGSFSEPEQEGEQDRAPQWLTLSVALCASANVREANRMSFNTLPRPMGTPDKKVMIDPIWTTWAKMKTKVDQQKVLEFAREIVKRDLPRSVLEIDDRWQSAYGDVTFDPVKFPDPKKMVEELHAMGFKVTVWVHPFVEERSEAWREGRAKGYFVAGDKAGWGLKAGFFRWWQPQPVQAVDFTNDAAVEWYLARLTKFQRDYGIDGFKFDGGEPCFLPKNFKTKRRLQHPSEYTRAYLTRIAGKFQNGCSEVRTGSRTTNLALLTRMGDRFSVWSTSNGLRSLIPTLLTSSVLGYPFALPDMIGGNAYGLHRPTKELMVRWVQVSALMPAIQFSIPPWDFGEDVTRITADMLRLRATLADYILEHADSSARTLHGICRPLWWLDPADLQTYLISDQFAIGDDLIVAPVVREGQRARDVYLTAGTWIDLTGGSQGTLEGGQWLRDVPAPLERLPVYRRVLSYGASAGGLMRPSTEINLESRFFD